MELKSVRGIGPKTITLLNKLNIYSIEDLIRYYPYRYNVYSPRNIQELGDLEIGVITGMVESLPKVAYIRRNFTKLSFKMVSSNTSFNVVIYNRLFLKNNILVGKNISVIGKYDRLKNTLTANDIKLYPIYKTEVEPVYHVISGLRISNIRKLIDNALSLNVTFPIIIPDYISTKYELLDTKRAINEIHHPTNTNLLKQAKLRLKYEELFEFMFKVNLMKFKNQVFDNYLVKEVKKDDYEQLITKLPFELTNDQKKALEDIINDFKAPKRLNRLILGDVGSGKTIVSFIAAIMNINLGYQSAILAPTEVLAKQHYINFKKTFPNIEVSLLTGSILKKEKNIIKEQLKSGKISLIIGTHALLEEDIEFSNLGLVITDEQHRFGVNQRKALVNKGNAVDVIYMSATPIPRTYALTIYGDMDISIIREKPAGRKEIVTKVYKEDQIKEVANILESELVRGHQAYVIAPLISEDEESELNDIAHIESIIKSNLKGNYEIAILHGKMKSEEKERVMNNFKEGKVQLLISTTVIEVGVDVANATMMIIFNAERFGLATLHQLRGRVGRNSYESKCLLISNKDTERLKVLEESNDGFYISEKDFELRGSGDLFGIRQSGDMVFKIADLHSDYRILLQCQKDSEEFIVANIENNFRDYPYYESILQGLMENE